MYSYSLLKAEKTTPSQDSNDQDYQENETKQRQTDDRGNSLDSVQPPVDIGRHHFDHRKLSKQRALENICRIAFLNITNIVTRANVSLDLIKQ